MNVVEYLKKLEPPESPERTRDDLPNSHITTSLDSVVDSLGERKWFQFDPSISRRLCF